MRERDLNNPNTIPLDYDFGKWEASHYDHSRSNPDYDSLDNGEMRNRPMHWFLHKFFSREGLDNGCEYNEEAANLVWDRLSDDEKAYLRARANIS